MSWQTEEFLRLITFEALEMTHSCCRTKHFHSVSETLVVERNHFSCSSEQATTILCNLDPGEVYQIRTEPLEQEKSRNLEHLMEEFTAVLQDTTLSAETFEQFVWGYWRNRMPEFFQVDLGVLRDMETAVGSVQTFVTPRTVQRLLGNNFTFRNLRSKVSRCALFGIEETGEYSSGEEDWDSSSDGIIDCRLCDDSDSEDGNEDCSIPSSDRVLA
ncbi:hypothetical protein GQ53DRAFT_834573 [Thozetella sp. PMI_491]|nr:hypothetical protein GQ53DRAFT_834573 [Thozetella sp. PMI_491]